MAKNWMAALHKLDESQMAERNPHENVLQTKSPSFNFVFGRGHGLPKGFTLVMGGPPKGGKTLISGAMVGHLHQRDKDAIVIKFDTEFREGVQSTKEEMAQMWGVDPDRYIVYQTNSPMDIFDRIEKDIAALCQDGMPLAAVVIDSVNGIQGRRAMNADTIETQQIGDEAKTLTDGFKRILGVQRKYGFALILTCQIRAEMDRTEIMRNNKVKMALPFALQHYSEYFMFVEPNRNADAKTSLAGEAFRDAEATDMDKNSKGERTGHKIRVTMKDSSCGPKGRVGEFTLDYRKGIVNTWEEVFTLGVNRGVIERPSLSTYKFGKHEWKGKEKVWEALQADQKLQDAIVAEIFALDASGAFDAEDAKAAEAE
jgi:RecA/RadA recombinase